MAGAGLMIFMTARCCDLIQCDKATGRCSGQFDQSIHENIQVSPWSGGHLVESGRCWDEGKRGGLRQLGWSYIPGVSFILLHCWKRTGCVRNSVKKTEFTLLMFTVIFTYI